MTILVEIPIWITSLWVPRAMDNKVKLREGDSIFFIDELSDKLSSPKWSVLNIS